MLLVVLLVVLPLVLVIGFGIYFDTKLNRIDALTQYSDRVGDTPGTNWLLVGSDSRTDLSEEEQAALATGGDIGSARTDTIMLVHIPNSGDATIVSLPRDSYVPIPGHGRDKINTAFSLGGAPLLTETVETVTGVHIDHYAEIGFGGFAKMVDTLGGIEMCLPEPLDDPLAGINLQSGCQELDGAQALGYVRSREFPTGDLQRMLNQRLFMTTLLGEIGSASTLINPFKIWPLGNSIIDTLVVDNGDHVWNLAGLAWALRGGAVETTVPIDHFEDSDVGNVVVWDNDRASEFFQLIAEDRELPADLLTTVP